MTVWVLTEEYNAYDQYGDYFLVVYASQPTRAQLLEHNVPENRIDHVLAGGGRWAASEDHWFHLKEIQPE